MHPNIITLLKLDHHHRVGACDLSYYLIVIIILWVVDGNDDDERDLEMMIVFGFSVVLLCYYLDDNDIL